MSGVPSLESLIDQSAKIELAADVLAKQEGFTDRHQIAVNGRAVFRAALWKYLCMLESYLSNEGVSAPALKPLLFIADQIMALETMGINPMLFNTEGKAFGMTKPTRRLMAEGHAVGCVAYLHEVVGDPLTFSYQMVASVFSHLGHAGRVKNKPHQPHANEGLSWKTLQMWHGDLSDLNPELPPSVGENFRLHAKDEAYAELLAKDQYEPIATMPDNEARMALAERIMLIAAQSRIGMPGGIT